MWCFNRIHDADKILVEDIEWQGPFSWPGYEHITKLESILNIQGIYLFTFPYRDGFLLYAAGVTNSTKRRLKEHTREYMKGNYNVLDIPSALQGDRKEIWHGWEYARKNRDEFQKNKAEILKAVGNQLSSFRIFITEIDDTRKRERLEASLMNTLYLCKEPWSELADRGMYLRGRYNSELPILVRNICSLKVYGLPSEVEI
ncbi:MAG: hypothetical protein VKJ64_15910 [Leptolyngbyaceae bacterium]|nr:hypothetical protein [Leptolyngbyaceae bacterium]